LVHVNRGAHVMIHDQDLWDSFVLKNMQCLMPNGSLPPLTKGLWHTGLIPPSLLSYLLNNIGTDFGPARSLWTQAG
jgi:hypothetical protein